MTGDDVSDGAGDTGDRGDTLWAPWRLEYLESVDDPAPTPGGGTFLDQYWSAPDQDASNRVLFRDEHGMILLNRYPYANGHLLIALGEPRPRLLDYTPAQRAALWSLVERAIALVETTLEPQGVNVGVNQGRAAGAGVPGHLHAHVVPRWGGDVNFMTAVGRVRVIPASLDAMFERFRIGAERLGLA